MKQYPSILRIQDTGINQDYYTFDKLDGSNLRMEYSKKQGWYKWGTRTRLLDHTDPIFGSAIPIFMETLAEPVAKIIHDNRWGNGIAFCEFFGDNSFAGIHRPEDTKHIKLFDFAPYKQGLLGPKEFLKNFGHLDIPNFLGVRKWDRAFVDSVRNSELEGISFEGVVGKNGNGHDLKMVKCKTQQWLNEVKSRYTEAEAIQLINS